MECIYINSSGELLTLRQAKPFFLTKLSGTGNTRQTVNTFKAPEQDGAFFISSALDMRNITIEGSIIAKNVDGAAEYRKRLLRIFSPKLRGTLLFRGLQISCIVEEVAFADSSAARVPAFFISLLCPSPFFETPDKIRAELASWREIFSFPLEIDPDGFEFGTRQPSQIVNVDNAGDVSCGCEVVFSALGTVSNPELLDVDTGEFIRINTTLNAGEEIRVFTHFAGKRVIKISGRMESNAFPLLDTDSTFLQLRAGRNTLRYDADGNIDLLEVNIFYRPQFLGV